MESITLVGMQNAASVAEPYSVALGAKKETGNRLSPLERYLCFNEGSRSRDIVNSFVYIKTDSAYRLTAFASTTTSRLNPTQNTEIFGTRTGIFVQIRLNTVILGIEFSQTFNAKVIEELLASTGCFRYGLRIIQKSMHPPG